MKRHHRIRRDSLPATIIRHLEQSGLGHGMDVYPNSFWIQTDKKRGR